MAEPAVPSFLQWSESAITFDRIDHRKSIPQPGRYPLVVDPIIGMKRLTKVLMDGGNGLNIMYAKNARRYGHRSITYPTDRGAFPRHHT